MLHLVLIGAILLRVYFTLVGRRLKAPACRIVESPPAASPARPIISAVVGDRFKACRRAEDRRRGRASY